MWPWWFPLSNACCLMLERGIQSTYHTSSIKHQVSRVTYCVSWLVRRDGLWSDLGYIFGLFLGLAHRRQAQDGRADHERSDHADQYATKHSEVLAGRNNRQV